MMQENESGKQKALSKGNAYRQRFLFWFCPLWGKSEKYYFVLALPR